MRVSGIDFVSRIFSFLFFLLSAAPCMATGLVPNIVSCTPPLPSNDYTLRSIVYKYPNPESSATGLELDLYLPTRIVNPPLVILIHGGAWVHGSSKQPPIVSEAKVLVGLGYAVASLNYSLVGKKAPAVDPRNHFPESTEDVLCAVKWLKANSYSYGFNEKKIAVMGHSAGGYLASMIGTVGSSPGSFDSLMGKDSQCTANGHSASVQGVVAYYPLTDLEELANSAKAPTGSDVLAGNSLRVASGAWNIVFRYLGASGAADLETLRVASPVWEASSSAPPFFIVHGSADQVIPGEQSVLLSGRLNHLGVDEQEYVVPGLNHGFYPWDDEATLGIQNASPYKMNLTLGEVHAALKPSSCTLVSFLRAVLGR